MPSRSSTPSLMVIAAFVGAGAGLGAVALIQSIAAVEWVVDKVRDVPALEDAWMFLTVPLALWIAWFLSARLAPEVAGHGVPQIMSAIALRMGRIPFRVAPLKVVLTAITIGGGGSAGREGPIAQIGAALGSLAGRVARLGEVNVRSLVAAGAAAGIAATFNAPIAGMFFALEVILGSFAISHLGTVLVASVAGAVVSRGILGESLTFRVAPYQLEDPRELLLYALLGVAAVAGAYVYLRSLDLFETLPDHMNRYVRPLAIGLIVAAAGWLRPEVLGTGQRFVESVLQGRADEVWWSFVLLALLKAIATGATFGARGSGGIFMPALFIGAMLGAGFAELVDPWWGVSTLNEGAFALVAMAAVFSGAARAPLTSILIVFEATGDYGLVLPLMLATTIATSLAAAIHHESAYTMALVRKGIRIVRGSETDLLNTVAVGDVAWRQPIYLAPGTTLAEAQGIFDRHRLHGAPIVDEGALVGVLTVTDVLRAGGPSDQVSVGEAMTPDPVTTTPDTPVSDAMERMAALGIGRLPVVDENDPTQLVGVFRREEAVAAYHRALGTATAGHLSHRRMRLRSPAHLDYYDLEVLSGSVLDGRTVREVAWPDGCLVVSIHRGDQVLVAEGSSRLLAGDIVTAFGTSDGQRLVMERFGVPAVDADVDRDDASGSQRKGTSQLDEQEHS